MSTLRDMLGKAIQVAVENRLFLRPGYRLEVGTHDLTTSFTVYKGDGTFPGSLLDPELARVERVLNLGDFTDTTVREIVGGLTQGQHPEWSEVDFGG